MPRLRIAGGSGESNLLIVRTKFRALKEGIMDFTKLLFLSRTLPKIGKDRRNGKPASVTSCRTTTRKELQPVSRANCTTTGALAGRMPALQPGQGHVVRVGAPAPRCAPVLPGARTPPPQALGRRVGPPTRHGADGRVIEPVSSPARGRARAVPAPACLPEGTPVDRRSDR
jgi:hypothetical protein